MSCTRAHAIRCCIDGGLTLTDAAQRMFQIHARHLAVYTAGHLVGFLSDRDIANMVTFRGHDPDTCTAEQSCTPNPYVCGPDAPLTEVVQTMVDHKYGAVLVMDGGRLLRLVDDARRELDALRATLAASLPGSNHVLVGRPAPIVCEVAEALDGDLIVVGSHGFDRLDRLLGTNAARIVNQVTCSVLVVRPRASVR